MLSLRSQLLYHSMVPPVFISSPAVMVCRQPTHDCCITTEASHWLWRSHAGSSQLREGPKHTALLIKIGYNLRLDTSGLVLFTLPDHCRPHSCARVLLFYFRLDTLSLVLFTLHGHCRRHSSALCFRFSALTFS
ncbi:hypothetical protein GDO78_002359 [Eleutherodactylus coqui]|uniref:Uncharacterized protein n=1 Tax=Eleutherodactylus coqui TaxID=57060 RepID=A0A8J6K681_ELECQ|nr:hypothetical protein GDO78_002359 [Eleutherodactylus coqui]